MMATGRGITDTKIYDRDAVIDRYGIPPELIPDFYGLKGDTSDNIPGIPGIGDKTAAQLLQRFGDLETVLANVDEISGAKRKENLINHAEDARISKQLATSIRDVPVDVDFDGSLVRGARPLPPPRDLPRVRAARPAAAARGGAGRGRRGRAQDRAGGRRSPLARARSRRPRLADARRRVGHAGGGAAAADEDQLPGMSEEEPLRFAAYAGGEEVLVGEAPGGPAELLAAWGGKPVVAHDWKSLIAAEDPAGERPPDAQAVSGVQSPPLEHDTLVAAYLIDPARRGYPLDELAEELGLGAEVKGGDRRGRARRPHARAGRAPARRARGAGPHPSARGGRAAAGRRPGRDGARGREARREDACERSPRGSDAEATALEREIWDLAGEEFTIGSPQQLGGRSSSTSSGCRRSGAARPASRPTRACSRRSAPSTRSSRRSRTWRELTKLK